MLVIDGFCFRFVYPFPASDLRECTKNTLAAEGAHSWMDLGWWGPSGKAIGGGPSPMNSSWKLTFFFSPIVFNLSLYHCPPWNFDPACLSCIIHFIFFIIDPFIGSTRYRLICFNLLFFIVCRNKLTWIHWILVSFMMHSKSPSYHHIFHFCIFTLHLILCLSHACCCSKWGKNKKTKLN